MLLGLSVAGLAVFVLVMRAVLRSTDHKTAGLREANRVPLSLVGAARSGTQERD